LSCSYIFIYHNNVLVLNSFFIKCTVQIPLLTSVILNLLCNFRSPAEQKLTLRHSVPWSVHCGRYLTVVFVASMYE
jgi:hypothetical protein